MPKGGKIIRPDGTVANGRKKLADPKVQTTCYFLKSAIEKLGKEQCRLIAEQAINEAVLAKDLEQYVILPAMEQFAEISKNDVIDSIIIDLTRRGFFLNPSKMKSQMLEVIRSHKNSNVDSDSD